MFKTDLQAVEDAVGLGVLLAVGLDLVLAADHECVIHAEKNKMNKKIIKGWPP